MKKGIIIFGSSRSEGNTRKVCNLLRQNNSLTLIDLNNYNINPYHYEHIHLNDDFIPLIEQIINYDLIIFATPVYWYSASTILKTFIDRLSDLVRVRKDLMNEFHGKRMMLISCSSDETVLDYFHRPFEDTSKYMKMEFSGYLHTYVLKDGEVPEELFQPIKKFSQKINEFLNQTVS